MSVDSTTYRYEYSNKWTSTIITCPNLVSNLRPFPRYASEIIIMRVNDMENRFHSNIFEDQNHPELRVLQCQKDLNMYVKKPK